MIKFRYPGEWHCTVCDVRENEYGVTMQSWTRSAPPKLCWRCFARNWLNPKSAVAAACAIVVAFKESGYEIASAEAVRQKLAILQVSVEGVSPGRLSAMVYRCSKGE